MQVLDTNRGLPASEVTPPSVCRIPRWLGRHSQPRLVRVDLETGHDLVTMSFKLDVLCPVLVPILMNPIVCDRRCLGVSTIFCFLLLPSSFSGAFCWRLLYSPWLEEEQHPYWVSDIHQYLVLTVAREPLEWRLFGVSCALARDAGRSGPAVGWRLG